MNKKLIVLFAIVLIAGIGIAGTSLNYDFSNIQSSCPNCVKTVSKPTPTKVDLNIMFVFPSNSNYNNFITEIDARYFDNKAEQAKEIKRIAKVKMNELEASFEDGTQYALCLYEISDTRFQDYVGYCYDFTNKELIEIATDANIS